MRFLFIIQGEGRGHMTQAIAFSALLEKSGQELVAVILGKSKRRVVPEFFTTQITAPIYLVESPNFEADRAEKKILLAKTIIKNLWKLKKFGKSLSQIHSVVKETEPDIILNFYDLLGGLYNGIYRPRARYWVIGHQYLNLHPEFIFAPARGLEKLCFQANTFLTRLGAEETLALSFNSLSEQPGLRVVPPLLRDQVKQLSTSLDNFFLCYIVNPGYSDEVIHYAKANPELEIKAFWDKKDIPETFQALPNLTFYQVHDQRFLQEMAKCKGLICTSGFESICEAYYLGKPVMTIPVEGQYEQACNAIDAARVGAGIPSKYFDFGKFEEAINQLAGKPEKFRQWENSWSVILSELTTGSTQNQERNQRILSFS